MVCRGAKERGLSGHRCEHSSSVRYDQPKGIKQTVEAMGLVWQATHHRGIDDARNVAAIVKEMIG
jgi:inhibitor of KinA sporulation pathway (predicted exonuclease)